MKLVYVVFFVIFFISCKKNDSAKTKYCVEVDSNSAEIISFYEFVNKNKKKFSVHGVVYGLRMYEIEIFDKEDTSVLDLIELKKFKSLVKLDIESIRIKDFGSLPKHLSELRLISCEFNPDELKDIPPNIKCLNLSYCQFKIFDFKYLPQNIDTVILCFNGIDEFKNVECLKTKVLSSRDNSNINLGENLNKIKCFGCNGEFSNNNHK